MPKSRRDKTYSLTQTKKQVGLEHKEKVLQSGIQWVTVCWGCVADPRLCEQLRANLHLLARELAQQQTERSARRVQRRLAFLFGQEQALPSRVRQIEGAGTGRRTPQVLEELRWNFATLKVILSGFLVGETGLLFTNKKEEEVVEYFNKYNSASYARVGEKSEVTVKVQSLYDCFRNLFENYRFRDRFSARNLDRIF